MAGIFKDIEFPLNVSDGSTYLCEGACCITDNGYHNWACLIPPHKHPTTRDDVLWSEWVESVRKDVECFFGKMKARWQFLKVANRCHSPEIIEKAFECCCIINNILLDQSTEEAEEIEDAKEASLDALDPNRDATDEVVAEEEGDAEDGLGDDNHGLGDGNHGLGDDDNNDEGAQTLLGKKRKLEVEELSMFNFKAFTTSPGPHFSPGFSDFDKLLIDLIMTSN